MNKDITLEDLEILQELINEEIKNYLESGYKLTNEYVVNLRNLLKKFNLKEIYVFDRWLDE